MARTPKEGQDRPTNTLQTLDRGLQALSIISQQPEGLSIAALAARLAVHRAIAYRLATTLESHGLIARDGVGHLHLGAGLLTLAARFEPQLRAMARPILRELAGATGAAAFLSVPQGDECIAILVAEPEGRPLHVAYRIGSRHPLALGAAGIAILAGRPESPGEPEPVRQARAQGFSLTRSELQRGAVGIASPLHSPEQEKAGLEASLGLVALDDLDVARATPLVVASARRLAAAIGAEAGP